MRGLLRKFGASVAVVATFAFAAPVFAAGTLTCTPSTGPSGTGVVCHGNSGFTIGETCDLKVDTGTGYTTVDTTTADGGGWCFKDPDEGNWMATASGTLKVTGSTSGDTNTQTFTMDAPAGFTLAGIFDSGDMETAATTAITQVGPYALAVFGILMVVGIAMALLKRAQRKILLDMGKTPGEIREMQRAESAQRKRDRVPRRGRDRW